MSRYSFALGVHVITRKTTLTDRLFLDYRLRHMTAVWTVQLAYSAGSSCMSTHVNCDCVWAVQEICSTKALAELFREQLVGDLLVSGSDQSAAEARVMIKKYVLDEHARSQFSFGEIA